jgi:hypothetical protein
MPNNPTDTLRGAQGAADLVNYALLKGITGFYMDSF